jgi:uncharacterized membrane protein YdjX (TVP38/TMEM64 family)
MASGTRSGRQRMQKLARSWLDRLMQPAERHGFLTVLIMRVFPVAPFTLVNFFVGASGIRFGDFFLASLLGIPGIILLTLVGVQVENVLHRADATDAAGRYTNIDAFRPRLVIQARPDGQSASKAILSIVKD